MKRLCAMCRQSFEESEFYKCKTGFNAYCKSCERIYQREYKRYYRTLDRVKEYNHEYYLRRKNSGLL